MLKSRLLRAVGIVAIIGGIAGVPAAQTQDRPAFDVASVKPNRSAGFGGGIDMAGARLTAEGVTLEELVRAAYGDPMRWLPSSSIVGEPTWMKEDKFDVVATAGNSVPAGPSDQKRLMIRTLLADRFKMALRHETRDGRIYTLSLARSDGRLGPSLTPAATSCGEPAACAIRIGLGNMAALWGRGQPLSSLVNALSHLVDQPVVDHTGLTGVFDVDMRFNGDVLAALRLPAGIARPDDTATDVPSFFTALQEQLGLKLESTKGPVDVLVIDHVEHPTPD
jgi:uncharacterized protein (TIGR03435 family)